MDTTRKQ